MKFLRKLLAVIALALVSVTIAGCQNTAKSVEKRIDEYVNVKSLDKPNSLYDQFSLSRKIDLESGVINVVWSVDKPELVEIKDVKDGDVIKEASWLFVIKKYGEEDAPITLTARYEYVSNPNKKGKTTSFRGERTFNLKIAKRPELTTDYSKILKGIGIGTNELVRVEGKVVATLYEKNDSKAFFIEQKVDETVKRLYVETRQKADKITVGTTVSVIGKRDSKDKLARIKDGIVDILATLPEGEKAPNIFDGAKEITPSDFAKIDWDTDLLEYGRAYILKGILASSNDTKDLVEVLDNKTFDKVSIASQSSLNKEIKGMAQNNGLTNNKVDKLPVIAYNFGTRFRFVAVDKPGDAIVPEGYPKLEANIIKKYADIDGTPWDNQRKADYVAYVLERHYKERYPEYVTDTKVPKNPLVFKINKDNKIDYTVTFDSSNKAVINDDGTVVLTEEVTPVTLSYKVKVGDKEKESFVKLKVLEPKPLKINEIYKTHKEALGKGLLGKTIWTKITGRVVMKPFRAVIIEDETGRFLVENYGNDFDDVEVGNIVTVFGVTKFLSTNYDNTINLRLTSAKVSKKYANAEEAKTDGIEIPETVADVTAEELANVIPEKPKPIDIKKAIFDQLGKRINLKGFKVVAHNKDKNGITHDIRVTLNGVSFVLSPEKFKNIAEFPIGKEFTEDIYAYVSEVYYNHRKGLTCESKPDENKDLKLPAYVVVCPDEI